MVAITYGIGGIGAWRVLQRSQDQQVEILSKDAGIARATRHFEEKAALTVTAEELVGDYQMLAVTLGAFGLEADQGNRAFIEKILNSNLEDGASLANRLSDKRYLRLAEAFQTGIAGGDPEIVQDISQDYLRHQFELRVGEGDDSLRLALNAKRQLQAMATRDSTNNTLWYEVLGNAPMREVFATAFGFGKAFDQLPIDRQLAEFSAAADRHLGSASFADFTREEGVERLISLYLVRDQVESTGQDRYSVALALLTGG
jgi:hypothetical protein